MTKAKTTDKSRVINILTESFNDNQSVILTDNLLSFYFLHPYDGELPYLSVSVVTKIICLSHQN